MIDYGLLMSVLLALAAPSLLMRFRQPRTYDVPVNALDVMLVPGLVGVVVGRLSTLAIDDPRAIGKISDMLVVRSGVEFWPAVIAAVLVVGWSAHRAQVTPVVRVAELAPFALVAYGAYEAACLFRDGCYGPVSPVGLTPDGLTTSMLPIGILMGIGAVVAAWFVWTRLRIGWPPVAVVAVATVSVGLVRSLGSIWLPNVGGELSRQHRTSIAVTVIAGLLTASELVRARRRLPESVAP